MSPVLPFDIIALIIDIVGENNDTNLLKELALVSHSFLHICSKHLFATVDLHDNDLTCQCHIASKKRFVKLLESRPDVVKYIRKLTYTIEYDHVRSPPISPLLNFDNDDNLLSPILPNFLRTIPRLKYLKIDASLLNWNVLNPSLTSAFLHLMHLPTINHIDLSFIYNFPLSSLTPCVNLLRLDICQLSVVDRLFEGDGVPEFVFQSEIMPKILEFRTFDSSLLMTKLLHAKTQDGQPVFNFMDLRRVTMSSSRSEDDQNIQYLLQNAKSLENLHLYIGHQSLIRLHDIPSISAGSLKVFDMSASLYSNPLGLTGLWEEMAGLNMLEALSFEFQVDCDESVDFVGSILQKAENILVRPGWPALRQVSIKIEIIPQEDCTEFVEALQSLPDKYLTHLPNHESVAFDFSAYVPSAYVSD